MIAAGPRAWGAPVRRHALFGVLLVAGAGLRALAVAAYEGAVLRIDSLGYLANAAHLGPRVVRPMGYAILLWLLPLGRGLVTVAVVQHLLGLAMAIALYALLVRLTVPPWVAALAVAPVLLDVFQLAVEHQVMSETLFESLLVAAAALLLWRRPPSARQAAAAGVLLAGAALTRGAGTLLVVPALLTLLAVRAGRAPAIALIACFVLPLGLYVIGFHAVHGQYSTTGFGSRFLYGRVARFADCRRFPVPRDERVLCPSGPPAARRSTSWYTWSPHSPVSRIRDPRSGAVGAFARRVILHQPLDYLRTVGLDLVRGFAPERTRQAGEPPVRQLRFVRHPALYQRPPAALGQRAGRGRVRAEPARLLRTYQRGAETPGPLMAAALIAGLLAALGLGRARRSDLRAPALLFSAMAVLLLLTTVAVNEFTWRYWIPELVLIPPAGAAGAVALLRRAGCAPAA